MKNVSYVDNQDCIGITVILFVYHVEIFFRKVAKFKF